MGGGYIVALAQTPEGIFKNYPKINDAMKRAADTLPMTGFVSANGLTPNPDNLHFSAKSLWDFGNRYFREFEKLRDPNKVFSEKPAADFAVRTEMEAL